MKKIILDQEREFEDGIERIRDISCEARNYYAYLELKSSPVTSQDEIKKAYHDLSLKYHPDRGKESDGEKFKEIKEAYKVLSENKGPYNWILLDGLDSRQVVPEFKCAGCSFKSDKLFWTHSSMDGTELKFCTYLCLPDCANEQNGKLECESKYGKCYKRLLKSKKYGNLCSEICFDKLKEGVEWLKKWSSCIKCGNPWKDGEQYRTTTEGIICSACMGEGEKDWKCCWCEGGLDCCEKNDKGVSLIWSPREDPSIKFCSQKCIREWRKSLGQDNEELEKEEFIANKLKKLTGWNLLSQEEKANFIEQVNNSNLEQFENILRQAKNLIREKQSLNNIRGRENDSDESNTSVNLSDSGYDSNNSHESEQSEEIPALLSLAQSQTQAEQKIQKSLKENSISEAKLNQILGGTDWKEALKKLDTLQKVEEFINKIEQEILKIKLSEQDSSTKDQNPKNEWVLPVIISVVSFLALTSLVLIVRRKKMRLNN